MPDQMKPHAQEIVKKSARKIQHKLLEAQNEKIYKHMVLQEQVRYIETIIAEELALFAIDVINLVTDDSLLHIDKPQESQDASSI